MAGCSFWGVSRTPLMSAATRREMSRTGRNVRRQCIQIDGVWDAAAAVRARAWAGRVADRERPLVLDIDSTLVEVHSRTPARRPITGYGFHDAVLYRRRGAAVGQALRITVLDRSIGQLPDAFAAGHRRGDDPAAAAQPMNRLCSASIDAGTATSRISCRTPQHPDHRRYRGCAHRWLQRAVGGPQSRRARSQAHRRARAQVTELTEAVDLSHWARTRLIVRREPLHPGAQRTLFDAQLALLGVPRRRRR